MMADKEIIVDTDGVDTEECEGYLDIYFGRPRRIEQKLQKIKDYCLKNKVAGWVDVEGIIEIIERKENGN